MDRIGVQDSIGKALGDEVERLEIFLFGRKRGGWPETDLTLGALRKMAEEKAKAQCQHS